MSFRKKAIQIKINKISLWMERITHFLFVSCLLYGLWCYFTENKFSVLGHDFFNFFVILIILWTVQFLVFSVFSWFGFESSYFKSNPDALVPVLFILGWIVIIFFISKHFYGAWWDLS
jgi:hypothetical protein